MLFSFVPMGLAFKDVQSNTLPSLKTLTSLLSISFSWSNRVDSNHRAPPSKGGEINLTPLLLVVLELPVGLEPTTS